MSSLRILIITHTLWSKDHGAARVPVELAHEWKALGHHCEKFSLEDSGLQPTLDQSAVLCDFPERARAFVRDRGRHFDVIDAQHTNLPFLKSDLRFDGLLVARSVGLIPIYDRVMRDLERRRLFSRSGPRAVVGILRRLPSRLKPRRGDRVAKMAVDSLVNSDVISVCNRDEESYVRHVLGSGDKVMLLPFGVSKQTRERLRTAGQSRDEKLANKEVVFIGQWSIRKGSQDWSTIVRELRSRIPSVQFLFLGTHVSRERVLRDLGQSNQAWIKVVEQYRNDQLPDLLSSAAVGAFPSYVEGFPFAVLEMLTAGIPVVAYDAPGAREMLFDDDLIPVGNEIQVATRIAQLLSDEPANYKRRTIASEAGTAQFCWSTIAATAAAEYATRLAGLRRNRGGGGTTAVSDQG